jgi:hypothetical protein
MQAWKCGYAMRAAKQYEKLPPRDFPGGNEISAKTLPASECFDFEHLTATVATAGRAGDVRRHLAAALGAALEDRCTPAGSATAHFLTAFGLAALWYGHGRVFV